MRCSSNLEEIMNASLEKSGFIYDEDYVSQFPIRSKYGYVLDFAFPDKKIAIECDGKKWHPKDNSHDRKRDAFLRKKGWTILRFTELEITTDIESCIKKIKEEYHENKCRNKRCCPDVATSV